MPGPVSTGPNPESEKVLTHLVEALLLQALPQNLADPRQSADWFVSHRLTDKVPMLLRCGGHPAATNEPEPEVSTRSDSLLLTDWNQLDQIN